MPVKRPEIMNHQELTRWLNDRTQLEIRQLDDDIVSAIIRERVIDVDMLKEYWVRQAAEDALGAMNNEFIQHPRRKWVKRVPAIFSEGVEQTRRDIMQQKREEDDPEIEAEIGEFLAELQTEAEANTYHSMQAMFNRNPGKIDEMYNRLNGYLLNHMDTHMEAGDSLLSWAQRVDDVRDERSEEIDRSAKHLVR